MATIEIYITPYCPYCVRAKDLLNSKGVSYQEYDISNNSEKRQEMMTRANKHTVPQIFINNKAIGGCDELYDLNNEDKLDILLNK